MITNILNQRPPARFPGRRAGSGNTADLGGYFSKGCYLVIGKADGLRGGALVGHLILLYKELYENTVGGVFNFRVGQVGEIFTAKPVDKLVYLLGVGVVKRLTVEFFLFVSYRLKNYFLVHFVSPVNHLIGIYLYNNTKVYTCQVFGVSISKIGQGMISYFYRMGYGW